MATMQEQLREIMGETLQEPRGNVEGTPEVEPEELVKSVEEQEEEPTQETAEKPEEPEEASGIDIESLASDLELKTEELYQMQIPVRELNETLSVSEMKNRYLRYAEKDAETKVKAEEVTERERIVTEKLSKLDELAAIPAELIQAEAQVRRAADDYASIDWQALEVSNPGEAALQRQKLTEAYQIAEYNRQQMVQRLEGAKGELQRQREDAARQAKDNGLKQLKTLIPDWQDETKFKAETSQMVEHAKGKGIPEHEINNIQSPEFIQYLYESWKRDVSLKADAIEPLKALKPETVKQTTRGRKVAAEKLRAQAAKSKDNRLKMKAVSSLLTGQ